MPRDINGVYTLPAGNPVIPGTVISTNWANSTLNDVATALTASVVGPASTTADNEIPRFDGTTGKKLKAGLRYQTSPTDTTAGALMINGAWGLGGRPAQWPLPSVNGAADVPTGFYWCSNQITKTPYSASWYIHHKQWAGGDYYWQEATEVGTYNKTYWRSVENGVTSAWQQIVTGDSGPQVPVFQNGWVDAVNLRYRKIGGVVYLIGGLTNPNPVKPFQTVLQLPVGFRPAGLVGATLMFSYSNVTSSLCTAVVDVNGVLNTGFVYEIGGTPAGAATGSISISFPAA